MTALFRILSFVKHFFISGNEHRLHSPFLFSLYINSIRKPNVVNNIKAEKFRSFLIKNNNSIEELDFGTGNKKQQKIAKIAQSSLKSRKEYLFLANLCHYLKPERTLELGTCFGLSTSYLKEGATKTQLTTLEGNPNRLAMARTLLSEYDNINIIEGNIDLTLEETLKKQYDLIYIDANHTEEATIRYYELIKNSNKGNLCIVFDDIYYSQGMNRAWKYIKKDQNEAVSLDFYHFGLVFFRKEMLKQHFNLKL